MKWITYDKMSLKNWLFLKTRINLLNKSHVTERYLRPLESLGIIDDGLGMDLLITENYRLSPSLDKSKTVVLALGGSYITKRIPIIMANAITKNKSYHFILLGGSDVNDEGIILRNNVTNLINKTTMLESASIIEKVALLISGDTGMMHMASALKKPIIVIWGSTSEDFGFYPYFWI